MPFAVFDENPIFPPIFPPDAQYLLIPEDGWDKNTLFHFSLFHLSLPPGISPEGF